MEKWAYDLKNNMNNLSRKGSRVVASHGFLFLRKSEKSSIKHIYWILLSKEANKSEQYYYTEYNYYAKIFYVVEILAMVWDIAY